MVKVAQNVSSLQRTACPSNTQALAGRTRQRFGLHQTLGAECARCCPVCVAIELATLLLQAGCLVSR